VRKSGWILRGEHISADSHCDQRNRPGDERKGERWQVVDIGGFGVLASRGQMDRDLVSIPGRRRELIGTLSNKPIINGHYDWLAQLNTLVHSERKSYLAPVPLFSVHGK
jgi:hypothetical protein